MNIAYNTAGIAFDIEGFVQWSSFLWDLRTKLDVTSIGATSATVPAAGETLIRKATQAEWDGYGSTTAAAITVTSNGGKLILFHPTLNITSYALDVVIHEVGHAIQYRNAGFGSHSLDADDIMYYQAGIGAFPVSTADAEGVNLRSSLAATDTPDITSAAMRWDNDLFIPDILIGGASRQVQLDYAGVQGGKHTWNIWSNAANEEGVGTSAYVTGTAAYLPSVQSVGQDYASVNMTIVGSQVQLDSWTLV